MEEEDPDEELVKGEEGESGDLIAPSPGFDKVDRCDPGCTRRPSQSAIQMGSFNPVKAIAAHSS